MLVSLAILEGFRIEIRNKIVSFGGHLQVGRYDLNNSYEEAPMNTALVQQRLQKLPGVRHAQAYAHKTAIIKTKEEVAGVVLKGVAQDYDLQSFHHLLKGGAPLVLPRDSASDHLLVSQRMADKLRLKPGDSVLFYFIQDPPRIRKLRIQGIFATGLEEFDDLIVLGDLRQVQQLKAWPDSLVGGYEVILNNFDQLDASAEQVNEALPYDLQVRKITDLYVPLFDWLALLKRNVQIFIVLILVVITFNIVSTLFIMILERTAMIGLLKSMGARDRQIRQIFFYKGLQIAGWGLLLGNAIGLGFCLLQDRFKLIPLDPENYYMETVPIQWAWPFFLSLNALMLLVTALATLVPTVMIARVKPSQAIRFD
jgi:lipoprotein-releasing system permease protein